MDLYSTAGQKDRSQPIFPHSVHLTRRMCNPILEALESSYRKVSGADLHCIAKAFTRSLERPRLCLAAFLAMRCTRPLQDLPRPLGGHLRAVQGSCTMTNLGRKPRAPPTSRSSLKPASGASPGRRRPQHGEQPNGTKKNSGGLVR